MTSREISAKSLTIHFQNIIHDGIHLASNSAPERCGFRVLKEHCALPFVRPRTVLHTYFLSRARALKWPRPQVWVFGQSLNLSKQCSLYSFEAAPSAAHSLMSITCGQLATAKQAEAFSQTEGCILRRSHL